MRTFIKQNIVVLFFLVCIYTGVHSQVRFEEMTDRQVLGNKDTLLLDRRNGDFWFGAVLGGKYSYWFNGLSMPENPFEGEGVPPMGTAENKKLNFSSGSNLTGFTGLSFEWARPGNLFGAGLKFLFYDYSVTSRQTVESADPIPESYTPLIQLTYLTLSPDIIFHTRITGLHLFAGLDLSYLMSSRTVLQYQHTKKGDVGKSTIVTENRVVSQNPEIWRYGGHAGIGYNFFFMDINHRVRLRMTPFISFHSGGEIYRGYGSTLNNAYVQIGVSIKAGVDRVMQQLLPFDPYYERTPDYIAQAHYKKTLTASQIKTETPISGELTAITRTEPDSAVAVDIAVKNDDAASAGKIEIAAKVVQKFDIGFDKKIPPFSVYPTQKSILPDQDLRDFLDDLVRFLQENPKAYIRVVGYSDNQGTLFENEQRARDRANKVVQYLLKKGIPRLRIYAEGRGSRDPIADNINLAGQRKNRRVEIEIFQK